MEDFRYSGMRVKILSTILATALAGYAHAGDPAYQASPAVLQEMQTIRLELMDARHTVEAAQRKFDTLYERLGSVGETGYSTAAALPTTVPADMFGYDPNLETKVLPAPLPQDLFTSTPEQEADVLPPPSAYDHSGPAPADMWSDAPEGALLPDDRAP